MKSVQTVVLLSNMASTGFETKIENIKKNSAAESITPRELLNALGFERRTKNNCAYVDNYLKANGLETEPNYNDVWIDATISLKIKDNAKNKVESDPVRRLRLLKAANTVPMVLSPDTELTKAITLMHCHDFSQIPIANGNQLSESQAQPIRGGIKGYISWESIANVAYKDQAIPKIVSECMVREVTTLSADTPILKAIKPIIEHNFILVKDTTNAICGIVTISDVWDEIGRVAEPFILIEEIEKNIRHLLRALSLTDINAVISDNPLASIDDMTFGEYIRVMENESNWEKLNIRADRVLVKEALDEIREIRNNIMHFDPDGTKSEDYEKLRKASRFVGKLCELQH